MTFLSDITFAKKYRRYLRERWCKYVLDSANCGKKIASYETFYLEVIKNDKNQKN